MKTKKISVILLFILIAGLFISCESNPSDDIVTIKFNNDFQYAKYGGKQVTMRGYMSTLSPMDGKYIYLMNLPYQSCPFCLPNTTTIVNTIAIYAASGKKFDFYDGPIEIAGTLMVGETTDEFGYQYPFKIIDAKYTKVDTSQLSDNLKIYGALSQDGIISDIMRITGQVDFNAFFEMYEADINDIQPVSDDDFNKVIRRINAIGSSDYEDIIEILGDFKEYNDDVNNNIDLSDYDQNCTPEMENRIISLFNSLFVWLNKFEI